MLQTGSEKDLWHNWFKGHNHFPPMISITCGFSPALCTMEDITINTMTL